MSDNHEIPEGIDPLLIDELCAANTQVQAPAVETRTWLHCPLQHELYPRSGRTHLHAKATPEPVEVRRDSPFQKMCEPMYEFNDPFKDEPS